MQSNSKVIVLDDFIPTGSPVGKIVGTQPAAALERDWMDHFKANQPLQEVPAGFLTVEEMAVNANVSRTTMADYLASHADKYESCVCYKRYRTRRSPVIHYKFKG